MQELLTGVMGAIACAGGRVKELEEAEEDLRQQMRRLEQDNEHLRSGAAAAAAALHHLQQPPPGSKSDGVHGRRTWMPLVVGLVAFVAFALANELGRQMVLDASSFLANELLALSRHAGAAGVAVATAWYA